MSIVKIKSHAQDVEIFISNEDADITENPKSVHMCENENDNKNEIDDEFEDSTNSNNEIDMISDNDNRNEPNTTATFSKTDQPYKPIEPDKADEPVHHTAM